MSQKIGRKFQTNKEDNNLVVSDLPTRYPKLKTTFSDNLKFEIKYLLITIGVLVATFANIHKNNISNYNFKLLLILLLYFMRRLISKIWYQFRLSEKLIQHWYPTLYYIFVFLITINFSYLLVSLFMSNSSFHIMALFMVAILQIPQLGIFPGKDKRYENAPQEMLFSGKKILFLSAELVYYNICIPMLFSQKNNFYINTTALCTYSIIIFLHAVLILFSYTYFKHSADFHIYSKMMGCWKLIKSSNQVKLENAPSWTFGLYEKHAVVKHKDNYYIAIEDKNAADPSDYNIRILYHIFISPKEFFMKILICQAALTVFTLIFIIQSYSNIFSLIIGAISWHNFYFILEKNKLIQKMFIDK